MLDMDAIRLPEKKQKVMQLIILCYRFDMAHAL